MYFDIVSFIFQNTQAGGDRKNDTDKDREKKKKESILDLNKYLDKPIRVKFSGGREGEICNIENITVLFAYMGYSLNNE